MKLVCPCCKKILRNRCASYNKNDEPTWSLCFDCDAKIQEERRKHFLYLGMMSKDE